MQVLMGSSHSGPTLRRNPTPGGEKSDPSHVLDATRAVETAYKTAAMAFPTDEDQEPLERPKKKKQMFSQEAAATKKISLSSGSSGASVTIGTALPPK